MNSADFFFTMSMSISSVQHLSLNNAHHLQHRYRYTLLPNFHDKFQSFSFSANPISFNLTNHNARCKCNGIPSAEGKGSFMNPNGDDKLLKILRNWIVRVQSLVPGGSWWILSDTEGGECSVQGSLTVWAALRRIWDLVGNDRWILYVALGSLVIAALSEIAMPALLATCVFSSQSGNSVMFYRSSRLLVVLCISSGICSGLRSGCFATANTILVKCLREAVYSALLFQDISYFDAQAVGSLTSRLGADCQQLANVIGNDINLILRNLLQGTGALICLLTLSWPLALSALAICCILYMSFLLCGQYLKKAAKITQDFTASANTVAEETFSLIRTVRSYGTEEIELERYKKLLEKSVFISIRESVAYGVWNMCFNILYRSTQVVALLLGGTYIYIGHVSTEQLTKYILYCEWLIYANWRLVDSLTSLIRSIGASQKVFQFMDLLPSTQFSSTGVTSQRLMGHIEFVNVSFHYSSRVPILKDMCLSIRQGEVVAIVGPSGSGKSSLINLLLRLYEPINGEIYVDGFPLEDFDIGWLRERIGYVGQEPPLFHMDIKSNITYGFSGDINREHVEQAAKQAFAHEFISSLPNGYETIVDDALLSGGQKQRIAIARAIFRDPDILILDEPTSALDPESQHHLEGVVRAFRNGDKGKRTVIVVAHRLATIKTADRILVMNKGEIVETGVHAELLLKGGLYARLVNLEQDSLS